MAAADPQDPTRSIRLAAQKAARRRCLELCEDEPMVSLLVVVREDGPTEHRDLAGIDASSTLGAAGAAIASAMDEERPVIAAAAVVPETNGKPGRELILVAIAGPNGEREIYSARRDGRRLTGFLPGPKRPWLVLADSVAFGMGPASI